LLKPRNSVLQDVSAAAIRPSKLHLIAVERGAARKHLAEVRGRYWILDDIAPGVAAGLFGRGEAELRCEGRIAEHDAAVRCGHPLTRGIRLEELPEAFLGVIAQANRCLANPEQHVHTGEQFGGLNRRLDEFIYRGPEKARKQTHVLGGG